MHAISALVVLQYAKHYDNTAASVTGQQIDQVLSRVYTISV